MVRNETDRRVRRTRAQLQKALLELLEEKDIRSITVQELARRADVNRGTFYAHYTDVYDLLDQMDELKKMGPLSSVMNMIPGAAGKMSDEDAERSEKEMARSRAIIYSMTPAERAKPSLIDPKRKRRIAAGSGTKVEDVNRLLRQLEQSRKLMKMMSGKGGKKAKRMGFPGGFPGGMPGMM